MDARSELSQESARPGDRTNLHALHEDQRSQVLEFLASGQAHEIRRALFAASNREYPSARTRYEAETDWKEPGDDARFDMQVTNAGAPSRGAVGKRALFDTVACTADPSLLGETMQTMRVASACSPAAGVLCCSRAKCMRCGAFCTSRPFPCVCFWPFHSVHCR